MRRSRVGRHRVARAAGLASIALACATAALPGSASAGQADVVSATAVCSAESVCRFAVTVQHADEGWKHYANRWQVLAPDGKVLATRILRHPHVAEQPFTRSLDDVKVPETLESVRIRAGDSKHGFGGAEVSVSIHR